MIVAEMFNSALEAAVDLSTRESSELARTAKDIAAGSRTGQRHWFPGRRLSHSGTAHCRHLARESTASRAIRAANIAVLAVIMIMLMVILIKAHFGNGFPLRGGFPSGHSASAFSLWISLLHVTANPWFIACGFLAALLVAANRLRLKIHTLRDVFFGALLGSAVTLVLFRVFYR